MAIIIGKRTNLDAPIKVESLNGVTFTSESEAHQFVVRCAQNGQDLTLAGTISAKFIRADGNTIQLVGSIVDGAAVVTLAQDCYNVQGRFQLAIFNTVGDTKLCIYACVGTVQKAQSGSLIDGGGIIPDVEDLIADIQEAVQSIPPTYDALLASIAGTYSATKTYAVGDYVWYDGSLYRCTTAITTAEAWTSGHWTAAVLGDDVSDLKSAFEHHLNLPTNLVNAVALRSGKFVFSDNGNIANSTICDASDYIDITGISEIVYPRLSLISTTTTGGIAFYNEQKEYISGVSCIHGAETNGSVLDIASVPTGAKYVRLSLIKSDPKFLYNAVEYANSLGAKIDAAEDDIINLDEDISNIKSAVNVITGTIAMVFEDGYIDIPSIGSTASLTRTAYTDRKSAYERVSAAQPVAINVIGVGTTNAGGRAYAFLDENLKVLSRATAHETVNNVIYAPDDAYYVVVNTRTDTISDYYAYVGLINQGTKLSEIGVNTSSALNKVNAISETMQYDLNDLSVLKYWIDISNNVIDLSSNVPERLVVVPVDPGRSIHVTISKTSTKRIAFCDSVTDQSTAYSAVEVTGQLNAVYTNTGNHKYLVIQLFVNTDTDKDYTDYLATADISVLSAVDTYARIKVENSFFVPENLKGLPILDNFGDIEIDTSAYDDCTAFHALVKSELCDTSNGYLVQTLLGDDGHGNNLYKYVTNPATVKYGADRRFGTPDYPISGGYAIQPFTVIITTNIHGIEHGGNWVVYNLLKKMQTPDSDMLRFFKDNVKIIWVPYICPSGDYENADGVNINRDFPTNASGSCTSNEGNLVKAVIDQYAPDANLHLDIHTFTTTGTYAQYFASWTFTDSDKLGRRSAMVSKSVVDRYAEKYPTINILQREVVSAVNTPTTCTYYTQSVYGIPAGTIEGALQMDGSPSGSDSHTSATAYLYDIITQVICAMT